MGYCPENQESALPARAVPAIMRPAFAVAEAEHSNLLLGRL